MCRRLPTGERLRLFFPEPYSPDEDESAPVAKRLCEGCPARPACLAWACADEEDRSTGEAEVLRYGIAGGLLARERTALRGM